MIRDACSNAIDRQKIQLTSDYAKTLIPNLLFLDVGAGLNPRWMNNASARRWEPRTDSAYDFVYPEAIDYHFDAHSERQTRAMFDTYTY
jgi:hypothetical protein